MQPLSIKIGLGVAREVYRLRRREVHVQAGSYLVLNEDEEYGHTLKQRAAGQLVLRLPASASPSRSSRPAGSAWSGAWTGRHTAATASFSPHLRADDRHVTPRMRYIHERVQAGERSQDWLDTRKSVRRRSTT